MRLLPRTPKGTWRLAAALWVGLCALTWPLVPARPRVSLAVAGTHRPLAFRPDGKWLVTATPYADGANPIHIWDAATGQPALSFVHWPTDGGQVYFSPDSRWLLLLAPRATAADRFTIWDLADNSRAATLIDEPVGQPAFSPTEPLLAWPIYLGKGHRGVRLLELPSLQVRAELRDAQGPVAFTADGRTLATVCLDEEFCVATWDAVTGQRTAIQRVPEEAIHPLMFSPDGQKLVAASWPSGLQALNTGPSINSWGLPDGRRLFCVSGAWPASICADSGLLIVRPRSIQKFDLDTGLELYNHYYEFSGREIPYGSVGGRWLAASGGHMSFVDSCREWLSNHGLPFVGKPPSRRCVDLMDVETGGQIAQISGVGGPVLSPDGRSLAVTSDHATEIWDVPLRPSLTYFGVTAAVLALPPAGLAWRRVRRLRREVA